MTRAVKSLNALSSQQTSWVPVLGTLVVFLGVPLAVFPSFLDFAQEAKSYSLSVVTLMALCVAVLWPKCRTWQGAAAHLLPKRLLLAIGLLAATALVSYGQSAVGSNLSRIHALRNLLLPLVAAYVITPILGRYWIIVGLSIGAAFVGALGLAQVAFDIHYLTPVADPGQFPGVTFGNRGLASMFVALGVVPTLFLIRETRKSISAMAIGAVAIQAIFVTIALTRSTLLAAAVSVAIWGIAERRRRTTENSLESKQSWRRWPLLVGIFAIAGVGAVAVMSSAHLKTLALLRLDPGNWLHNPRFTLWKICIERFADAGFQKWMFGFGPGSFQVLSLDWVAQTPIASLVFTEAHNDYLQLLLEYGFSGIGLWLVVVIAVLNMAFKQSALPRIKAVFAANLIGLLIASSLFYFLQMPYFAFLFWIGIFSISQKEAVRCRSVSASFRRSVFRLVAVAGVALLAVELYGRFLLETEMRSYVSSQEPYLMKRWRQKKIGRLLNWVPAPAQYQVIVDDSRLQRVER